MFIANAMWTHWHVLSKMQTNTSLTTLCSYFLLSYGNQAMTKTATDGHGHVICMGNLGGVLSHENTPEGCTETYKSSFFLYKQVSGSNGDHESIRMTNAFILCDLV